MRPFAFWSASGAPPAFDMTALALSGWWRADYAGSPWTPTASAGTSGSNGNLTEGTNPPSVGTPALNGLDTADFDGTNDQISPGGNAGTFFDAEAFSGWILFNADAVDTDSATTYANDCLITTGPSAYFIVYLRSSGEIGIRFVASGEAIVTSTFTIGVWTLVQWKYDGVNIKLRVDGGTWESTACTGVFGDPSNTLHFGRNYAPDAFFDGQIAEIGLADIVLSDGNFNNIKAYVNTRYGLAL